MTIQFVLALAVLLAACSDEASDDAEDCCPTSYDFPEPRTYDTGCIADCSDGPTLAYTGSMFHFESNGHVSWLPSGDITYGGAYRYCGSSVFIAVSAPHERLRECFEVAADGSYIESVSGQRYNRTR